MYWYEGLLYQRALSFGADTPMFIQNVGVSYVTDVRQVLENALVREEKQ